MQITKSGQNYRVLIPMDHPLAAKGSWQEREGELQTWLRANCQYAHLQSDVTTPRDIRFFLGIYFRHEEDAFLFKLMHQKPGDRTNEEVHYTRDKGFYRDVIKESELNEDDRDKFALTYEGHVSGYQYFQKRGSHTQHCYSSKKNVAGYYLCWETHEEGDFAFRNVSASKTKRIVIDRARKRAGV